MGIFKNKYGDWHEGWELAGMLALLPVAFLVLMLVLMLGVSPVYVGIGLAECHDIAVQTSLETKWTFWHGCYVNWNGQWLTQEMFRAITIMP